jgi:hypothetical protein
MYLQDQPTASIFRSLTVRTGIGSNLLVQIEMPMQAGGERRPVTLASKTGHGAAGNMQCAVAFYPQEEESPWII